MQNIIRSKIISQECEGSGKHTMVKLYRQWDLILDYFFFKRFMTFSRGHLLCISITNMISRRFGHFLFKKDHNHPQFLWPSYIWCPFTQRTRKYMVYRLGSQSFSSYLGTSCSMGGHDHSRVSWATYHSIPLSTTNNWALPVQGRSGPPLGHMTFTLFDGLCH